MPGPLKRSIKTWRGRTRLLLLSPFSSASSFVCLFRDLCVIITSTLRTTRMDSLCYLVHGPANEVSSSRTRYLFYSQLTGDSNPEAYNRVLLAGGRCVELDCYDGKNGEPIVTHAHTLVKPCSFESIIRCMEPNLFKTSPWEAPLMSRSPDRSLFRHSGIRWYWISRTIVLLRNNDRWLVFWRAFSEVSHSLWTRVNHWARSMKIVWSRNHYRTKIRRFYHRPKTWNIKYWYG